MKAAAARLHRKIGIALSLFLLGTAVSGMILALKAEILATAFAIKACSKSSMDMNIEQLLARAREQGRTDQLRRIALPTPGACDPVILEYGDGFWPRYEALDPGTGDPLDEKMQLSSLVGIAHAYHISLFGGQAGQWVVGVVGLGMTIILLLGLIQWWPGINRIAKSLRISGKGGQRGLSEIHKVTGVMAALLLLPIALTGTLLAWTPLVESGISQISPLETKGRAPARETKSLTDAIHAIQGELPGSEPETLQLSGGTEYRLLLKRRENLLAQTDVVRIDRKTGKIIELLDARTNSTGSAILNAIFEVHIGSYWRGADVALSVAAAMLLFLSAITAMWLWGLRRPARRKMGRPKAGRDLRAETNS